MLGLPNEPQPGQPIIAADIYRAVRYVKNTTPRQASGILRRGGSGGNTLRPITRLPVRQWPTGGVASWTFKLYNTSQGATGQIQVNGNDNLVAQLNGVIAKVNSTANNIKTGGAYPQLSITGNGYVYAYCTLSTSSGSTSISEIDIYYQGSQPSPLTDAMTYAWVLLGTISDYSSGSDGNVTFTLANAQTTGYSQFMVCGTNAYAW
jgi:hypothetical protein